MLSAYSALHAVDAERARSVLVGAIAAVPSGPVVVTNRAEFSGAGFSRALELFGSVIWRTARVNWTRWVSPIAHARSCFGVVQALRGGRLGQAVARGGAACALRGPLRLGRRTLGPMPGNWDILRRFRRS